MNIMWAVERPGPFGEPWVSAHATKASALVNAANWGRDVQVVDVAAMPAAEFAALSARVAKLEAALRFYGDAENYKRQPVVDSFTGGTVPPNCPDKDAHFLAKFSEINGAPPHFCGATEDDETERHEVYWPGMADYPAVVLEGGAKARAALEEPCKGDSPEAAEEDKP